MIQRILLVALGLPIAVFCFWGSWELARRVPDAPQAALAVAGFVAIGVVTVLAVAFGALGRPR